LFQSNAAQPAAVNNQEVSTSPPKGPPPTVITPTIGSIKSALQLFDEANTALKNGDFAKYGELQKQLRKILADLAAKS
jgi:hypothetical protein